MDREILEAANAAAPELMQKTAAALALIERDAPEFLEDVVADFNIIADVTHEKVAAVSIPKSVWHGAAAIGTAAGAALGSALAADLFDAAKRGLTKSRNFKRIMAANPDIKNVADPSRIKPAYNAIHRYAPDFTADPMIGGALLKNLAEQPPGNEHRAVLDLLGSRKSLQDIKSNQFHLDVRGALSDAFKRKDKAEALNNPGATPTNEPKK